MVIVSNYVWVPRTALSNIVKTRERLTVIPRKTSEYSEPMPIRCYVERDGWFGFPRYYFFKNKTKNWKLVDKTYGGISHQYKFKDGFQYREGQEQVVKSVCEYLRQPFHYGAIICAPPAYGKTILVLGIIKEMGIKPVLITVHTTALLKQWIDRINEFMVGVNVGIIQSSRCEYKDKDIVVGMIESLAMKDYELDLYSHFGMICFDEQHRLGCDVWSRGVPKFVARYRIGVTGTPHRNDRADNVFIWHTGDILRFGFLSLKPKIRKVYTNFMYYGRKMPPSSILLKLLTKNSERNKLIVYEIIEAVKAGRSIFVASDRLRHLSILAEMFDMECKKQNIRSSYDFFVGGRTEKEYEKAKEAQVLFMTFQFAGEGVDIPARDTIFLTTPKVAITKQVVGRILRVCEGKKDPIVVDFIDKNIELYRILAAKRMKIYDEMNYKNNIKYKKNNTKK